MLVLSKVIKLTNYRKADLLTFCSLGEHTTLLTLFLDEQQLDLSLVLLCGQNFVEQTRYKFPRILFVYIFKIEVEKVRVTNMLTFFSPIFFPCLPPVIFSFLSDHLSSFALRK